MPIKSVKMKILKNKKKCLFFLMSQGSLNPKIRFLDQKVCPVARVRTDRRTYTKVNTGSTLFKFQDFFLQPFIKDRPNNSVQLGVGMNDTYTFYSRYYQIKPKENDRKHILYIFFILEQICRNQCSFCVFKDE